LHGLVNRSIQCFIKDTYGDAAWADICQMAALGFDSFESLLTYDASQTEAVLTAAGKKLLRSRAVLLEDMGTYLVSHPDLDPLRRLLRFGGETFEEFLHSLDDLHDRARLALPEMSFPRLELREHSANSFSLYYRWGARGFGTLALGILRAMADDYGALVLLNHATGQDDLGDLDVISIELLDAAHASGREFDPAAGLR